MQRTDALLLLDDPAGFGEYCADQVEIEHVVVEATIRGVVMGSLPELLGSAGSGVAVQVVQCENFLQMRQVIFLHLEPEVVPQMLDGRARAPVVEGPPGIGECEDQVAAGAQHTAPLAEGSEGVGHVFEAMGREHEIIGVVGDSGQAGRFAQILVAGWLGRIKAKGVALVQGGCPSGVCCEVHVIDASGAWIDGELAFGGEERARATDLETDPVFDAGEHGWRDSGLSCGEAIERRIHDSDQFASPKSGD